VDLHWLVTRLGDYPSRRFLKYYMKPLAAFVQQPSSLTITTSRHYYTKHLSTKCILLEVMIGVRYTLDTTPRYQNSAVKSTEKNQLSHEPHDCCCAAIDEVYNRDDMEGKRKSKSQVGLSQT
jgi:hypothetical protein